MAPSVLSERDVSVFVVQTALEFLECQTFEDDSTSVVQNVGNLDPVTPSHLIPGNLLWTV